MSTIIEAKELTYKYPEAAHRALKGVSLSVEKGEKLAILGPNGCGKSTLAKLMNALYTPTSGSLTVAGLDAADEKNAWQVRAHCGMVFQNPDNQLVATVVEEDVAFGLENLGVAPDEIRARVDAALESVGMSEYALTSPHMLSGGQKQRVAIAGVLAMRPEVIVFDESTAMLDPVGRAEVLSVVDRLNREEGMTVIWITHFVEEAARCDRVAVMEEGKIALLGTPREVFSKHREEVREKGLDVPEMTLLAHELRASGLNLPEDILSVDEMVVELCRLKSSN